jgi:hypothetical protein
MLWDVAPQEREYVSQMHLNDEFLRHAAECELMAKFARKPEDKTTWRQMAERWLRCAELFTEESSAAEANARMKLRGKAVKLGYH